MKTQFKIDPITINYLDKGFERILLPFRCFQHLVFLSSFSIEYHCIRPHRASYYILSFIGVLAFIIFHVYNTYLMDFDENTSNILFFFRISTILVVVPFSLFYLLNIIQRDDHVRLILMIQKAFRLINFKKYKIPIIRNWLIILRLGIGFTISVALTRIFSLSLYFFTLFYFDSLLTYGAAILGLLRDGVLTWTSEVEYCSKICLELKDEKCEDKFKKLFQAYSNLLEAFDIFKKIFRFRILFQSFDTFFHGLIYIQVTLEVLNTDVMQFTKEDVRIFEIVTVLLTGKNMITMNVFNIHCEKLYMALIEVDTVCSRLLTNLQNTVEAKKLYKNVQRLNRAAFHKMTACRIFTIDGRLPFRFNNLVLEYTFVILQFAVMSWKNKTIDL